MNADIVFFFDRHMAALPIYEYLEQRIMERIPDVHIRVTRTQISFANLRGFACVSFNPCCRSAQRPDVWLTVSFGLGYRKDSPRIDAAVEPYPGRWTHHVMVGSAQEVDAELLDWLHEAAEFSANKR